VRGNLQFHHSHKQARRSEVVQQNPVWILIYFFNACDDMGITTQDINIFSADANLTPLAFPPESQTGLFTPRDAVNH